MREGRVLRSVDKGEQKKTVGMREHSREGQSPVGSCSDQSTEHVSQEMRVRQIVDQSTEVSIASGFVRVFARVHASVSSQDAQNVSQTTPSGVWS